MVYHRLSRASDGPGPRRPFWPVAEDPPLVVPSSHPLVHHKIASLRDKATSPPAFRRLVRDLAVLLAAEATADLPTRPIEVATPLGPCPSSVLAWSIAIVPILRAGLGMADGVLDLIPNAEVWHIGLYRDEVSLRPMEYYNKIHGRCFAQPTSP